MVYHLSARPTTTSEYLAPAMNNHPNRSRAKSLASNPNPDEIIGMRINAGITQQQAAAIVHAGLRTWQQWEAGDRSMHPAYRELFLLKTGQKKLEIDPGCKAATPDKP